MIRFTIVDFSGGSDECEALYIDGDIYKFKDYNKSVSISSFIDGYKFSGKIYSEERVTCKDEQLIEGIKEYGNQPPDKLKDI